MSLTKGKPLDWVKQQIKGILVYTKGVEEAERSKGTEGEGILEVSEMHKSIKLTS